MYREIIIDVSARLSRLGLRHGQGDLMGTWSSKRALNTPGPMYCSDVDNSGPGPMEAPNNVFIDAKGFPFVFRQPVNEFELRQVLLAATRDPYSGYGADGDQHWTPDSVRTWWQQRRELEALISAWRASHLNRESIPYEYLATLDRWHDYIDNGMETYLRAYSFFLREGRMPRSDDHLPML